MRYRLRPGTTTLLITIIGLFAAGCAANDGVSHSQAGDSSAAAPAASSPPPAASATQPASPHTAAGSGSNSGSDSGSGSARCQASQLSGHIRMMQPAAGNRYAALVLTNTSGRSCHTYGFVGMQLAGPKGNDLPTNVVRETRPAPSRVTLRPGQSAWARIHWGVVPGSGESSSGQCEPTPSRLLVIPPDERTQLAATWPGGSVCEHGKILTTALASGSG